MTPAAARPIRVMVVDDSLVVRRVLTEQLGACPDIVVVGTASDPIEARESIGRLKPDVLTLDIEMPRMDGLTFLGELMHDRPMPVVIVSSVAQERSEFALKALRLGAAEVVPKPGSSFSTPDVQGRLVTAIRSAAAVRPDALRRLRSEHRHIEARTPIAVAPSIPGKASRRVIAIGASTGGTVAIEAVLRRLPGDTPGIVIVQHMPPGFTQSFARRLDGLCAMTVREAVNGDRVVDGLALVAPGGRHMALKGRPGSLEVVLLDGPPVHHQRPAVDVLFDSVARLAPNGTVAALLTGMGADGADGMVSLRSAGCWTIAQDEASCVVFGMPREAINRGGACEVRPLDGVAPSLLTALAVRRAATPISA